MRIVLEKAGSLDLHCTKFSNFTCCNPGVEIAVAQGATNMARPVILSTVLHIFFTHKL